jgi:hypothetical protein
MKNLTQLCTDQLNCVLEVLQTIGGGSSQAENFKITGNTHFKYACGSGSVSSLSPPRPRPQCAGAPRRLPLIALLSHTPNFNIFYQLNNYTPQKSMQIMYFPA